jgi:hypothetical protein
MKAVSNHHGQVKDSEWEARNKVTKPYKESWTNSVLSLYRSAYLICALQCTWPCTCFFLQKVWLKAYLTFTQRPIFVCHAMPDPCIYSCMHGAHICQNMPRNHMPLPPFSPHKNLRLCNRCEIVGCILGQGQEGLCVCIYIGGVMNIKPKWHCQWLPSPWISSSSSCLLVPEVPPPPSRLWAGIRRRWELAGGGGLRIKRGREKGKEMREISSLKGQ